MAPELPDGHDLDLPGRGRTFVREVPGPPGAPTLLLLHGWTATADLNWFGCYRALGQFYRVVALDHRGHGRGIRTARSFRLEDCADDAVAVADVLGIERVVPVGYSMGGPIAQLIWRRHPERVAGLVLCATAPLFSASPTERAFLGWLGALGSVSRVTPAVARELAARQWLRRREERGDSEWALQQIAGHDWSAVLQAAGALSRYDARGWMGTIDVPTSVVVTTDDRLVHPGRQHRLHAGIPGAQLFEIDGDHDVVASAPQRFVPILGAACARVFEAPGRNRRAS